MNRTEHRTSSGNGKGDAGLHWDQVFVVEEQSPRDLGTFLARNLHVPEAEAHDLTDFGSIQVNGRQERDPLRSLDMGDRVHVHWPSGGVCRHYELNPARVLYRDAVLLAYDKEPGIPSQQTPSDGYNNLFAAVRRHLSNEGKSDPYVALHHRLDRETSGVMIFALHDSVNRALGKAFENREVEKEYLAWVAGEPKSSSWICREDISRVGGSYCTVARGKGKWAETHFEVLGAEKNRTLVLARPKTGRTHQIRLHLAAGGLPIIGDTRYGGPRHPNLLLHAWRLTLPHPRLKKKLCITSALDDFYKFPKKYFQTEISPLLECL